MDSVLKKNVMDGQWRKLTPKEEFWEMAPAGTLFFAMNHFQVRIKVQKITVPFWATPPNFISSALVYIRYCPRKIKSYTGDKKNIDA